MPSIGPVVYEIMPKARTTTFTLPRKESSSTAKADSKIPQTKTRILERNNLFFSASFPEALLRSPIVVWDSAARIESRLEMAAAKIPARINPLI